MSSVQTISYGIIACLLLAYSSCTHDAGGGQAPPAEEQPATEVQKSPSAPVDGAWLVFWNQFKSAADQNAKALIMSMINFPLPGAESLSLQDADDGLPSDEFRQLYNRFFDEFSRKMIVDTKASAVGHFKVGEADYAGSMAQKAGVRPGSRVYRMQANGITYYFAKLSGQYKLVWVDMMQAG